MKEQAVAIGRKRIETGKSAFGPTDPSVAEALVDLANKLGETSSVGALPAVIAEAEHVLDVNRDYTSRQRGLLYRAKARYYLDYDPARSVEEDRKAVQVMRHLRDKTDLVMVLNGFGQSLVVHHDYADAIPVLTEAVSAAESTPGTAKGRLAELYAYLGNSQFRLLYIAPAERSYRRALEFAHKSRGEDHEDVVQTKHRLGDFLCETERFGEGLKLIREALELAVKIKGPKDLFHVGGTTRGYARGGPR